MTLFSFKNTGAVYIVDGARTPFLKAKGKPGKYWASDLAVSCANTLLTRQPFQASDLDEVIAGCVMPQPSEVNIGRLISLRLGCGKKVPAWTVQRNCASGLQALDSAYQSIVLGRSQLVLAGGADAMSQAPLLFSNAMVNWFSDLQRIKSIGARLAHFLRLRPHFFIPTVALLKGLSDITVNMNMGQTAEQLAYRFGITRAEMDLFAVESHRRLAYAQDQGYLSEIVPIFGKDGIVASEDDGIRRDSTVEALAKLNPIFDKPFGRVTAGNSSQVTDGAAFLLLASEAAVAKYHLPVLARIIDTQWSGVDPAEMGLGPAHAIPILLQRQKIQMSDIDYWEINEAFSAQVLACLKAWEDEDYCRKQIGLPGAFGTLDRSRLNVDGGAIATGHPVGASGARLILHLAHILKREGGRFGVASLCIGGGQGGAMLIERM